MARRSGLETALAALLALSLAAAGAAAQQEIDRTFPLAPDGRFVLRGLLAGSVTVTGWDRPEVHVTGLLERMIEDVVIDAQPERVEIELEYRRGKSGHRDEDTRLEIRLPRAARVSIATVSARIGASGVDGDVNLSTISGGIDLSGRPKSLVLESVSGSIDFEGEAQGIEIQTVSGDIELRAAAPALQLQTVSGDMEIRGGPLPRVRCQSVSGDIDFGAPFAPSGNYEFTSHSGDVLLVVTEGTDAAFDLSTFSGDIDAGAFAKAGEGARKTRRGRPGMGRENRFTLGGGSAEVSATTFSGDLILERGD
ncbi:MAG: DUF4097 family beta strand repeat protein [Candidatus Eisenbacteria bacterium]|uniref:DUF4097 family beta strand repeat protein n=1 Tax=Eiseniibacteriota bacterium TaxID=2212470 RepID=A0A938BLB7_UNCEI|nr:DUF4097 family beta strand repeat protein [Candidatus Eisenbacteria bacterium]